MSFTICSGARKKKVFPPVRLAVSAGDISSYVFGTAAPLDSETHTLDDSAQSSTLTFGYGNYELGPTKEKAHAVRSITKSKSPYNVIFAVMPEDKFVAWDQLDDLRVVHEDAPGVTVVNLSRHVSERPLAYPGLSRFLRDTSPSGDPVSTRATFHPELRTDETPLRFRVEVPVAATSEVGVLLAEFDPPEMRAQRILARLEEGKSEGQSFPQEAAILKTLSRRFPAVRELFWSYFEAGSSPRLRWLAMESLALDDWPRLAPLVVAGIRAWDARTERAALLGGLVTARQHRVPDDLRAGLLDALRSRLQTNDVPALAGDDLEQTEVVCQVLDTFRDFGVAADLKLLRRFWQSDCAFPVRLRAVECASHIAARHANEELVGTFFDGEAAFLDRLFRQLAEVRLNAVENGTLLWRVAALLFARLGEEAARTVAVARAHPSLCRRLARLLDQSEAILHRYGHSDWLGQRKRKIAKLRRLLTAPDAK